MLWLSAYRASIRQTPHSDYFPWQYIISLPPAMFFVQIQADSFFIIIFCSGLIFSKYSIFPLKILYIIIRYINLSYLKIVTSNMKLWK